MNRQMDDQRENIIPWHYRVAGYNNGNAPLPNNSPLFSYTKIYNLSLFTNIYKRKIIIHDYTTIFHKMSHIAVKYIEILTLKMPGKPASKNVVCLCCLLNILANFSNLFLHTGKQ